MFLSKEAELQSLKCNLSYVVVGWSLDTWSGVGVVVHLHFHLETYIIDPEVSASPVILFFL